MSKFIGKPVKYSPRIAAALCERVATGESLEKVCQDQKMPEAKTAYRWLWEHKPFRDRYAWASRIKHGVWADKLVALVDKHKDQEEEDPAKTNKFKMDAWKNASQMLARAVVERDDPAESEEMSFEEIEVRFVAMAKEDPEYARHLIRVLESGLAGAGQSGGEKTT